jgi:hypothetical protein
VWVRYGRAASSLRKFFNENVKPNVPFEIKREVIELHNLVQP